LILVEEKFRDKLVKDPEFIIKKQTKPKPFEVEVSKAMLELQPKLHAGFEVTVSNKKCHDVYLPVQFKTPGRGDIYFQAKGRKLFITLSSEQHDSLTPKPGQEVYHIGFICFEYKNTWIKRSNNSAVSPERVSEDFNEGLDCEEYFVDYHISYSSKGILLDHKTLIGHKYEAKTNTKRLIFEHKPFQNIKYVALSCWSTPVAFKNFIVQ